MIKFFSYSGSKIKYAKLINSYLYTDSKIYVEPFAGSGGILFNLDRKFDTYVINDIDRNIIRIYKTFRDIYFHDYKKIKNYIFEKFGGFSKDQRFHTQEENNKTKESYYAFRNWFNETHWKTDTLEEGVYLHMLANSAINSFLRFGVSGVNNSIGNKFLDTNEVTFNNIKYILNKSIILNEDYREIFKIFPDAFYFLDPPYFTQESSYQGFNINEYKIFLKEIEGKEFLYTDIINEYNSFIEHKHFIREMRCTSPSSENKKNGNLEYLFSSKKLKGILDKW